MGWANQTWPWPVAPRLLPRGVVRQAPVAWQRPWTRALPSALLHASPRGGAHYWARRDERLRGVYRCCLALAVIAAAAPQRW